MTSTSVQSIDKSLLDQTSGKALESMRKRMNHDFHQPEDTIQRFLNAIEPDSYIRPHRHIDPDREEIFLVLRGSGGVILFNDCGDVDSIHLLDASLGRWGVDIPGGLYHTIISTESGSVFYEIKQGPYNPDADKGFSPWSPDERTDEAIPYHRRLYDLVSTYGTSLKT